MAGMMLFRRVVKTKNENLWSRKFLLIILSEKKRGERKILLPNLNNDFEKNPDSFYLKVFSFWKLKMSSNFSRKLMLTEWNSEIVWNWNFVLRHRRLSIRTVLEPPQKKDQKSLRSRKRGRFKEHKIGSKINWQGDRENGPIMFRSKDYAHIIKFLWRFIKSLALI
jgi:hypothetical protein